MSSVFFNKGENCIAAGRLFIEDSIHDQFVQKVVSSATGAQSCGVAGTDTRAAGGGVGTKAVPGGDRHCPPEPGASQRSCIKSSLFFYYFSKK